jgi:hypothetical protein
VDGNAAHRIFSVEGGESKISDLKIVGGRAEGGAGGNVNKTGGSLTLNRVTVSGGDAADGGIANTGGSLTILRSTVSGNGASRGAGVYNTATLQVDTSTISGNFGAFGGGLYNGGSGTTTLLGSTIANNGAAQDGGGIRVGSGTVRAGHTIIANNTADASGPDVRGPLTSDDYNLIGDTQEATIGGTTTHNLTGTDPKLGALADNGGPTDTHALLRGSPAIDRAPTRRAHGLLPTSAATASRARGARVRTLVRSRQSRTNRQQPNRMPTRPLRMNHSSSRPSASSRTTRTPTALLPTHPTPASWAPTLSPTRRRTAS